MTTDNTAEERQLRRWARQSGLRLVTPEALDIRRFRRGRGFRYVDGRGRPVRQAGTIARIHSLAIPPAYEDVLIAADARAHIQAVGRDEAGRTQYRYHPDWESVRELRKVDRLAALCAALPRIRRRTARDLQRPGLDRRRVLAAVVALIDRTHIRVGCEDYVHSGRSRGAATLLKSNIVVEGDHVRLNFRGKGGKQIACAVRAPALTRALADLQRLPGSRLFRYRDENGRLRRVTAAETNGYLREIADAPVSAKDFRTLAATAAAAERLGTVEPAPGLTHRRRQLGTMYREVAGMLGNTPAITRKSYVHRRLVETFEGDKLRKLVERVERQAHLSPGEAVVTALFVVVEAERPARAA